MTCAMQWILPHTYHTTEEWCLHQPFNLGTLNADGLDSKGLFTNVGFLILTLLWPVLSLWYFISAQDFEMIQRLCVV